MKVILTTKMNLGEIGDTVQVKNGYARNYLIPMGHALKASAANQLFVKEQRKSLEAKAEERLQHAKSMSEKVEGYTVKLERAVSNEEEGTLYGAITAKDISSELNAAGLGVEVDPKHVIFDGSIINLVGEYTANISFHPEVNAEIKIVVSPQVA